MRDDGGGEVQRSLRVPKRISRRYRERDTSTIVVYPTFRKFCLKKDMLYEDNSIWKPPLGKETPMLIQKPGLYSRGSPGGWDCCRGDMQIFVNIISRGQVFRHH